MGSSAAESSSEQESQFDLKSDEKLEEVVDVVEVAVFAKPCDNCLQFNAPEDLKVICPTCRRTFCEKEECILAEKSCCRAQLLNAATQIVKAHKRVMKRAGDILDDRTNFINLVSSDEELMPGKKLRCDESPVAV